MIPLLAPLFRGELAPYAETLSCAPAHPPAAIPIARLIHDEALAADLIGRYASHLGVDDNDLRPAASAWSLAYLWALLPPVAAAASVLQHAFPLQPQAIAMSVDATGLPTRFHITAEGASMAGESTAVRYGALLSQHLGPLCIAIHRSVRLPRKILWANTARYLEAILEQALVLTGSATVSGDRDTLLQQPRWPDGRRNPMYGNRGEAVRIRNGAALNVALHRQCCLYYRLPDFDYCDACPLAPRNRTATCADADAAHASTQRLPDSPFASAGLPLRAKPQTGR